MVSHLKGYCSAEPPKDGAATPLNAAYSSGHTKTNSKKRATVKQENGAPSEPAGNHSNHLANLHGTIVHDHSTKGHNDRLSAHSSVLPPSPSALSSSSSSSATTSSNSLESSDQIYVPYALLKSKKFKIDHSPINGLNGYKPSQTVQNFSLSTLKCL